MFHKKKFRRSILNFDFPREVESGEKVERVEREREREREKRANAVDVNVYVVLCVVFVCVESV